MLPIGHVQLAPGNLESITYRVCGAGHCLCAHPCGDVSICRARPSVSRSVPFLVSRTVPVGRGDGQAARSRSQSPQRSLRAPCGRRAPSVAPAKERRNRPLHAHHRHRPPHPEPHRHPSTRTDRKAPSSKWIAGATVPSFRGVRASSLVDSSSQSSRCRACGCRPSLAGPKPRKDRPHVHPADEMSRAHSSA